MSLLNYKNFILEKYKLESDKYFIETEKPNVTISDLDEFDIVSFFDNTYLNKEYHTFFYSSNETKYAFSAHNNTDYLYELIVKDYTINELSEKEINDLLYEYVINNKELFEENFLSTLTPTTQISLNKDTVKNFYSYKFNKYVFFNNILKYILNKLNISTLRCNIMFDKSYIKKEYMLKSNVLDIKLVKSKEDFSIEKDYDEKISLNNNKIEILKKFMSKAGSNIDEKYYDYFPELKPNKNLILYRGMSWNYENLYKLKDFSKYPFHINDIVNIKFKRATSWSTNLSIAEDFAQQSPLWIILQVEVNPDDVIADTRKLDTKTLDKLYYKAYQREVILKSNKYTCKVVKIGNKDIDDLKIGFDYDYNLSINMEKTFNEFAKKFIKNNENIFDILSYVTKNQHIFGDYAVEKPLLKIKRNKAYGVVEISYTDTEFQIDMYNWGTNHEFVHKKFNNYQSLIDYIKEYNEFEKLIINNF